MQQHRASILHRPLKSVGKCTEETQELEYQREQDKLAFKTGKAAATHDRITRSLYPTPADKQAVHQETQQYLEAHKIARWQEREAVMQQESKQGSNAAINIVAVADERPWLAAGNMYRDGADEKAARRRCEEEVAAANRGYAAQASLQRSVAQAQEQQDARQNLNNANFWNMGSEPTDRFAPRVSRKGAGVPTDAPRAPPPWATYDPTPAVAPAPAPAAAARYATPPYSTHTATPMPVNAAVAPYGVHGGYVPPQSAAAYDSSDYHLGPAHVGSASNGTALDGGYGQQGASYMPREEVEDVYPAPDMSSIQEQLSSQLYLGANEGFVSGAPVPGMRVTAPMTGMQAVLNHQQQMVPAGGMQTQQVGARYACRPASATRTAAPWATLAEDGSNSTPSNQVARAGLPTAPAPIYPTVPASMTAAGLPSNQFQRISLGKGKVSTTSVSEILGGRAAAPPTSTPAAKPFFPWN